MTAYTAASARLSVDGRYRYELRRTWAPGPAAIWVMLNPSVADAETDDATVRKCVGFSTRNGYGSIVLVNLYAYRATRPADLRSAGDPLGPDNLLTVDRILREPGLLICAWGAGAGQLAASPVQRMIERHGRPLHCLGVTAAGYPCHPGRIGYNRSVVPYRVRSA